jgi:glycosyltransferase involved in cell wall biosynthesis
VDESFDVTFVLPGLVQAGGVRAVFEISDRLLAEGTRTAIVVPERSLSPRGRTVAGALERIGPSVLRQFSRRLSPRRDMGQGWFPLRTPVIVARGPVVGSVPPSSAVVATSFRTAEELMRSERLMDRAVYFIQHRETWSGSSRRVDATWSAFDRMIVTSEWLREIALETFGKEEVGLAVYGVDHETFEPAAKGVPRTVPVIGFMWDDRPWKGGRDFLDALDLLRGRIRFEVRTFGLGSSPPPGLSFAGRLSGSALAEFYRSLDVFVCASWHESGPMTMPEAMACGVPVLTTDVGNARLWSSSGRDAVIVRPRDPAELAVALERLIGSAEERALLSAAGSEAIAPYTWERTAAEFREALARFGLLTDAGAA